VEGGQADQVLVPGVEAGDEALALAAEGHQDVSASSSAASTSS
jgi:hypothetical protein